MTLLKISNTKNKIICQICSKKKLKWSLNAAYQNVNKTNTEIKLEVG